MAQHKLFGHQTVQRLKYRRVVRSAVKLLRAAILIRSSRVAVPPGISPTSPAQGLAAVFVAVKSLAVEKITSDYGHESTSGFICFIADL